MNYTENNHGLALER